MTEPKRPVPVIMNDPWPLRVDADGVIRVGKGRLTLDTVIEAYQGGMPPDEIAQSFEHNLADVFAAIAYYLNHQEELKAYLDQQAYEAYQLREKIEAEQAPFPTRAELLERRDRSHAQTGQ